MRYLALLTFLFIFTQSLFASDGAVFVFFTPHVAIPKAGYVFGNAQVEINGNEYSAIAFKKGKEVFVLLPENEETVDMPVFFINAIGFIGRKVVIGANESQDGSGAWLFLLNLAKDRVELSDYVKYGLIDGYKYDFYYNLPFLDAPKDIKDIDGDGNPDIELDFYNRKFRMLLSIAHDKFSINYKSPSYLKSFQSGANIDAMDEYQFREYLLYGVLMGKLKPQNALDIYLKKNNTNMINIPDILSSTIRIKGEADKLGVTKLVIDYLAGNATEENIIEFINKEDATSSDFIEALKSFDTKLKDAHMDEEAFNDFVSYLNGSISKDEFEKYVKKSLVNVNGDVYSMLMGYQDIDKVIHATLPLKIVKFKVD